MQISSSSAATSSMGLQALRALFQTNSTSQTAAATGQSLPTDAPDKTQVAPPPGPPPPAMNGGGISADTMSALLGAQEGEAAPMGGGGGGESGMASDIIDEADTNGDGTVSIAELAASLGVDETDELSAAFNKVDTDANGQITSDELDAGLQAMGPPHGMEPPPPPPPEASDVASTLLASADADEGGSLSLAEIGAALGEDDTSSISDAFDSLDTDGDGALNADELTSAFEAMFAKQMAAYAAEASTTSSVSLAA